jgi:hypothetical protein
MIPDGDLRKARKTAQLSFCRDISVTRGAEMRLVCPSWIPSLGDVQVTVFQEPDMKFNRLEGYGTVCAWPYPQVYLL